MKIALFSNFLNHHQLPLCNAFLSKEGVEFSFVATEPIHEERKNMGYEDMNAYPFVVRAYENEVQKKLAMQIATNYDVVIFGASPLCYLDARMQTGKLTFRFCERSLKKGTWRRFIPRTRKKIFNGYTKYKNDNLYILGASAFTSYDLSLCGFNSDKCFKWGYFPKVENRDLEKLMDCKDNKITQILYAGRVIELKRVIDTLKALNSLVKKGITNFHFTIIGEGDKKPQLKEYVNKNSLESFVTFLPFMKPGQVREYMDKSNVFVFGSNFLEGWGAVVNEAMNSACVVVVSHAVGSSAFLIKQGENGFVYNCGKTKELAQKLEYLITNKSKTKEMSEKGYKTITELWTADVAVKRLLTLCEMLNDGKNVKNLFNEGPVSSAGIIKNNWY
ncbi:MAG: glycosyltransferase family 4 protein [Clostridia bacterium]|nr:glycosyltransferase family 4 protein [Clostridia bacterium]